MARTASRSDRQVLGAIRAVTYTVPDLRAIERAYVDHLGYNVAARGRVGAHLARAWGAAEVAGLRMLLLGPASGEPVFLRFVEDSRGGSWAALRTHGWNATEFVVQDVDALARRLEQSPFQIIGLPTGLTRFPMIRAMQAIGPAGECCYFTEVGAGSGLSLAAARSFVGRVFIVVAAGSDADELFGPYREFANALDAPVATPVAVISRAHGLPPGTLHRHGLVRLPHGTLIELDQYPPGARARACGPGRLPPGMAMVTFDVRSLAGRRVTALQPGDLPGIGGCCACLRGAAGELIELVAPAPD
ncbi:MAG TPA: hypothetical protein VF745_07210 [Steroidobacteraceae bacterium]